MSSSARSLVSALLVVSPALAGGADLSPHVRGFVRVAAPRVALTHVRVIDGTGAAPAEDQTVVVADGKIAAIGSAASVKVPEGAEVLALAGYTVIPGLVGMHNHLYDTAWRNVDEDGKLLPPGFMVTQIAFSAPRLYLGAGVTTLRTTGNIEGYTDLEVKRSIDAGRSPGPDIDATAPYLEGPGSIFPQMHQLKDGDDAREMVAFWARRGATSFKAYMNVTRAQLGAAIEAAHALVPALPKAPGRDYARWLWGTEDSCALAHGYLQALALAQPGDEVVRFEITDRKTRRTVPVALPCASQAFVAADIRKRLRELRQLHKKNHLR